MLVYDLRSRVHLEVWGRIWTGVQVCFCAQGWLFDSSSSRRSRTSVMKQGWPQLHLSAPGFLKKNNPALDFWNCCFFYIFCLRKTAEKRCFSWSNMCKTSFSMSVGLVSISQGFSLQSVSSKALTPVKHLNKIQRRSPIKLQDTRLLPDGHFSQPNPTMGLDLKPELWL